MMKIEKTGNCKTFSIFPGVLADILIQSAAVYFNLKKKTKNFLIHDFYWKVFGLFGSS